MTKWVLVDKDLVWREVSGQIVMLDQPNSRYLAVNEAGAHLWNALAAGGATEEELAEILVRRYSIDPARAAVDVAKYLEGLADKSMAEPAGDGATAG